MKKNKIFIISIAIALAAVVATGSLAYFQATDDAVNTLNFGDGGSGENRDAVDIDIVEHGVDPVVNEDDGTITWEITDDEVDSNIYENVYPSARLPKDPFVKNTGTNSVYVRLLVTVSNDLAGICASHGITDLATVFEGNDEAEWKRTAIQNNAAANTLTYVYTYQKALKSGEQSPALFDTVVVPAQFTQDDMDILGNTFDISIMAQSIQADGFADMAAAWAAWTE